MRPRPGWQTVVSTALALLILTGGCRSAATPTPTPRPAPPGNAVDAMLELAPASLGEGEKLRVVATTTLVGDVVSNVGGDQIALTVLMPVGADPHSFEPTPTDVMAVSRAHVVFANGLGLEEFLDELIENAGGDRPVVPVSLGIEVRTLEGKGVDPHVWFSPVNVVVWTENIQRALAALDPAHREGYETNARRYIRELEALDEWIEAQVANIPPDRRKMVTDHRAFGYFADRYGLEMVGAVVKSFSTVAEPSAQELAALEETIRQYDVPAIFVGINVNQALVQRVAEDTGIRLVPLYTGSLGPPGSGAETYLDLMRFNVNAIADGLGRQ